MPDNNTRDVSASDHDKNMAVEEGPLGGIAWHEPSEKPMRLLGFAWFEQDQAYHRLPSSSVGVVREALSDLARMPAGGQVQFTTNSKRIAVRVSLTGPADMDHMPTSGQCGVDLYEGTPGSQRFVTVSRCEYGATEYGGVFFEFPDSATRTFTLNFPLYKPITSLQIGLDTGALLEEPPPLSHRIAVYGTSIVHGGCVSRPGMAWPNILSRRLGAEVLNFGFSGNGRGDPEMAELLATLDPCDLYILDYDANVMPDEMKATLADFIDTLRGTHATVPIVVVSRPPFAHEHYRAENAGHRREICEFHTALVKERREAGDTNLHHHDGILMMGEEPGEFTVDGVHPTDAGAMRMANALEQVVRPLLA